MATGKAMRKRLWNNTKWVLGIVIGASFLMLPLSSGAQGKGEFILASKIIDQRIFNEQGMEIGEIDDLVIRRSGKIKKVTLQVGGFLDVGDKLIAMPFSKVRVEDRKILVSATQEQLEAKPEFDYYNRGLRPGYHYRRPYARNYRYYHYPLPYYYGQQPYPEERGEEPYPWTFSPGRFLASTIVDRDVINEERLPLGEVEDLIIDIKNRKVWKIIISAEDIRGEDSPVAVEYEPIGFTPVGIVYDISQKKVRSLPKYLYEQ